MARLVDCVEVITNNKDCVVLKIKEDKRMNLIAIGCFMAMRK